jgi:hypothetical protein
MWADQLVNHRKYVNQAWTLLVLTLVTAIFIVASLLPLVDPWYQAAALLSGGQTCLAGRAGWLAGWLAGR